MTAKDLLDLDPQVILDMTGDELERYLSPLIPLARAPYVGKSSSADTVKLPDGRRIKRSQIDAQLAQLQHIFNKQG